jgi:hypothetical protein
METHPFALVSGFLAFAKDVRALVMQDTLLNQVVNPSARLERGVELDQRLWPEHPFIETLGNVLSDAPVADLDETLDVLGVLPNKLVSESKDVHRAYPDSHLQLDPRRPFPRPVANLENTDFSRDSSMLKNAATSGYEPLRMIISGRETQTAVSDLWLFPLAFLTASLKRRR